MADTYDDTNRGAAFTPFPTQQLILQGKVNVDGVEKKVLLVRDETKGGKQIIEMYEKLGVFFENDKKGNESAPDYSGPMGDGSSKRIAGWKKMKDNKPYMSFQISDKQGSATTTSAPVDNTLSDDTIPF
tara:strand:- start:1317 stop:1703 length:387 start_codon:yes stop_codon:yes gene_type:complete